MGSARVSERGPGIPFAGDRFWSATCQRFGLAKGKSDDKAIALQKTRCFPTM
jgi:hypothetical protein